MVGLKVFLDIECNQRRLLLAFSVSFLEILFATYQTSNWCCKCGKSFSCQTVYWHGDLWRLLLCWLLWIFSMHLLNPSLPIALLLVTSLTWTIWKSLSWSIIVYVPYLALCPGLSHRPSPDSHRSSISSSLKTEFCSACQASLITGNKYGDISPVEKGGIADSILYLTRDVFFEVPDYCSKNSKRGGHSWGWRSSAMKTVVVQGSQEALHFLICCTLFADLQMPTPFRILFQACSSLGNADGEVFL